MLSSLVQSIGPGSGAATVAARIEALIAAGQLRPGERLPAVRALATGLGVSPATVAAGYRSLRDRGLVTPDGRHGTVVALQPPLRVRPPGRCRQACATWPAAIRTRRCCRRLARRSPVSARRTSF